MRWNKPTGVEALPAPAPGTSFLPDGRPTRVFVTVDAATVILLAFAFGFGNGWATARILGINPWIAPLIQPAVDLAVVGLMVGIRYLAIHGWTDRQLTKPRRWLQAFGAMTLSMNVALPLTEHHLGRAAWDAVGPILLIAWSELAPWLLRAIYSVRAEQAALYEPKNPGPRAEPGPLEEEPEPEEEEDPSVPDPEPEHANVIDITSANLRDLVRQFCIDWDQKGKTYTGLIGAAYQALNPIHPRTRRQFAGLCREEWDRLFATGVVRTPRPA